MVPENIEGEDHQAHTPQGEDTRINYEPLFAELDSQLAQPALPNELAIKEYCHNISSENTEVTLTALVALKCLIKEMNDAINTEQWRLLLGRLVNLVETAHEERRVSETIPQAKKALSTNKTDHTQEAEDPRTTDGTLSNSLVLFTAIQVL